MASILLIDDAVLSKSFDNQQFLETINALLSKG